LAILLWKCFDMGLFDEEPHAGFRLSKVVVLQERQNVLHLRGDFCIELLTFHEMEVSQKILNDACNETLLPIHCWG